MTFQATWHRGAEPLVALESSYRRLVSAAPHMTVFNEWSWIHAAAVHGVSEGREVRTLTVRDGDRLVACLPMTFGRERVAGLRVRTLRPLGYPLSDRIGIPVAADSSGALAHVIEALTDPKVSGADLAILSELPETAGYRALFDKAAKHAPHMKLCARAPILDVSDREQMKAGLSKSLKSRIARSRKKIQTSGAVRFERVVPRPEQVPDLLRDIAAIEAKSWKGVAGVGIFSTPRRFAFFEAVALALAAEGRLEILLLFLNDELVSYRFGFRSGATFLDYNFAHPLDCDALSVGRLLLADAIESASSAGVQVFDASRGSLTKPNILHDWTENAIEHDEAWFFARSVWGDLLRLAVVKARPMAKRLMRRVEMA